jgi:hypothetical protein
MSILNVKKDRSSLLLYSIVADSVRTQEGALTFRERHGPTPSPALSRR